MVKKSSIIKCYIIDTSYLVELFKIPGCCDDKAYGVVKNLFTSAAKTKSKFFVPVPCIFELGNHIGHVKSGNKRRELARRLLDTAYSSVHEYKPWTITPSAGPEILPELCRSFLNNPKQNTIGLTDWFTVEEARKIKTKYKSSSVHIWTKDSALKAYEPDPEPNPYLG